MSMKKLIVGVVAAASLLGAGSVTAAEPVPVVRHVETAVVHPQWYRSCGFANCSVYFNKRETRIAARGGALLTQLVCTLLDGTAAKLGCTGLNLLVGWAGDDAVERGRCVKISFSRWTGVPYYVGTYAGSRCA